VIKAVIPAMLRSFIEPHLPDDVEARWFATKEEALEHAPEAEIGWFDMYEKSDMAEVAIAAGNLKWLNSLYAGADGMPLDNLAAHGVVFTNGAGINAITIAEYVVMGMLTIAKGYREVVRAQDARNWLQHPPGTVELAGSKALLIGYGAIGRLISARLTAFDVEVVKVRRNADGADTLGPNDWRGRLGEFDYVILSAPATPETEHMIGAGELAAMKDSAVLINISRGSLVDQDALVTALRDKTIGAAFLDVTTPEPLPADNPLWSLENAHITMHLSGRSQDKMAPRSASLFLANLDRYRAGEPLENRVDLKQCY
jgi:phosphoglycerate dehydrogenase-like enzyme